MDTCWFQSRYDKVGPGGTGKDYINCPMDKEQYLTFVQALVDGQKTEFKQWEGTPYFDGCLPIEIMLSNASSGRRWAEIVAFSASATGWPMAASSLSTAMRSRHHCSRTSPGSGSCG